MNFTAIAVLALICSVSASKAGRSGVESTPKSRRYHGTVGTRINLIQKTIEALENGTVGTGRIPAHAVGRRAERGI
jgi:hypothetical protein